MIVSFLFFGFFSGILGLGAMQNTIIVFVILYLMEKVTEGISEFALLRWPLLLIFFIAIYMGCLYLNEHSYIIA